MSCCCCWTSSSLDEEEQRNGEEEEIRNNKNKSSNIPILVAVCSAALTTGGTTYAFGLYGETLKEKLHLTQSQLDTLSSATFFAGLLSWIPGLIVDCIGGKWSMVMGGTMGAASLLSYWVVAHQLFFFSVASTQIIVAVLSLLSVFIFLSCALVTGSVFKLIVNHCGPGAKGKAVGVAKGYVGLGAGLYAVLFESLARPDDLDFLILAATCFILAAVIPSLLLLPSFTNNDTATAPTIVDRSTPMHFISLYMGLLAMAVLVIGDSLLELFIQHKKVQLVGEPTITTTHKNEKPDYLMMGVLFLVWLAPIWGMFFLPTATQTDDDDDDVVVQKQDADTLLKKTTDDDDDDDVDDTDLEDDDDDDDEELQQQRRGEISPPPSRNLYQMLQTLSAWLLFVSGTLLVGSGITVTNNLGEMVKSLRFSNAVTPPALALFSVAQAFGRVATGAMSEQALQKYKQPRSIFVSLASVISIVSHLLLAVATTQEAFITGIALSGLAFGMIWPLMVLMVGDLFGTKNHGQNYMFYDGLTSAAGTLIMSKGIAQTVYDKHGDGTQCDGMACFSATHWAIVAFSVLSLLLSVCLPCTKLSRQAYGRGAQN